MSGNSKATKKRETALSLEQARRLFDYDPETGLFVRKIKTTNCVRVGDVVGHLHRSGYLWASVNGKKYFLHRLAWLIYHGRWPKENIDHINRNKVDNRIKNLREADHSSNSKNVGKRIDNKSGVVGVYWYERYKKWQVYINVDKLRIHLGYFDTLEEAVIARKAAEVKYGFSPTYGK